MTDEEYLESAEVGFFLKDLAYQISSQKPEDQLTFSERYFQYVSSGKHIIGSDYSHIIECNHNRKSFVCCLMDMLAGFHENMELTIVEMHLLIESLSPNFPKSVVMEAASSVDPVYIASVSNITNTAHKYLFKDFSQAMYCQILFDEWLKLMEEFFREESSLSYVSVYRVKAQVKEFHNSLPSAVNQPSSSTVSSALEASSAISADGDITFPHFRKCIFSSKAMAHEVYTHAATIKRRNCDGKDKKCITVEDGKFPAVDVQGVEASLQTTSQEADVNTN